MRIATIIPIAIAFVVACVNPVFALNSYDFQQCIASTGSSYGLTCSLDYGTYSIPSPGWIVSRSGITVTGSGTWPSSLPTLIRADNNGGAAFSILQIQASNVLVENLTIDGNRSYTPDGGSTFPMNCETGATTWTDVMTTSGVQNVQFQDMVFQNSPGVALAMAPGSGTSSPSWSYVYQSIFTNARYYGIQAATNSIIDYNTVEYIGTNAITVGSYNALVEYNYLYQDHDEWSFAASGGQINVGTGASSLTLLNNDIDGNNAFCPAAGCTVGVQGNGASCSVGSTPNGLGTVGVEYYGQNATFTNNELTNAAAGIDIVGANGLTINGAAAGGWTQYYIENNYQFGIYGANSVGTNQGAYTFNNLQAKNNTDWGVYWADTPATGTTLGWTGSGACLTGNGSGGSNTYYTPWSSSSPSSTTNCF